MVRILYITEIFPDTAHGIGVWGGGEKQFYEVSRHIAKMGHDVTVLTCRFPGQPEEEVSEGMRIKRIGRSRELTAGGASRSASPLSYVLRTGIEALGLEPDLIHCNTYFPVFAGKMASVFRRIPVVATFHDIYGFEGWIMSQQSLFWGLLGHFVTTGTVETPLDRVIAVSPQCKAKLERLGVRRQKIRVIPNGVDLNAFDASLRQRMPKQILFVGRLVNFKHADWLVSALPQVISEFPEARLKIVGGGPEKVKLEALAKRLGVEERVTFTGTTASYGAVVDYYKESELFVLPSTVEGEAIVLKEAMAAKLPVIAMRVPGSGVLSLVRDGENGLLADPDNLDTLKDSILKLLSDKEKAESMGSAGRASIEQFDWNAIAERTLHVYQEVL